MNRMIQATALLLCVVGLSISLSGQVTTATVTGTVTDSTGAIVPGATVALKNVDTNVVRTDTSGPDGSFHFLFVTVGKYALSVSRAGFQSEELTDLQLNSAESKTFPIHLSVARQNETVEVNASQMPQIQTATSDQESTLPETSLNTLPVQHQDWTTMLQLSTATIKPLSASTVASTSPQGSGLNVNGLASVGYNLTVDGTNATSNPEFTAFNFYQGPNVVNTVNNDAIAEVGFAKGIAPATVGNTLSSNINIVTKSGTDQYHGSLYEINEEALYDGRNQFLTTRRGKTFNEYGGSIGGRIIRDKLFAFGSYTGARLSTQSPVSGTVPTPYLESISPSLYAPVFSVFPAVAQPSNNPTALTTTFLGADSQPQKDGNGLARIDYYWNPKNQFAVRYIRARPYESQPAVVTSNPQVYDGHMDNLNATYSYFGDRWTNNARFGFNNMKFNRINKAFYSGLPTISYAGFTTGGVGAFFQHGNVTSYEDAVVYVRGKHSLQMGGILERVMAARFKFTTATISYSTATQWTNNTPQTVLDTPNAFPSGTPLFGWTTWNYGAYVQDDYRISQNLTLNLGIRYDYYTVPKEAQGRVYNRGILSSNPSLGWGFGPFRPANSMYDATFTNIEPRIGFAYMPAFDSKMVIRGGFGIFAVNHTIYGGPVDTYGLPPGEPMNFQLTGGTTPGTTMGNANASGLGLKYPVSGSFTAYQTELAGLQTAGVLGTNLAFENVAGYFPDPTSIQYFLGIERALPYGLAAKVHYMDTRGQHLNFFETRNLPDRITGVAPVSNFSNFFQFQAGDRSNYNGLQAELSKQLEHGVLLDANYTWSKVLSFGDADILQPTEVQNNACPQCDYGPAPFDIRQRFLISGIWRVPLNTWLHADTQVARALLGGWEFGGIYTGETGLPVNITDSASSYPADRPNWGSGPEYVAGYRKFGAGLLHQFLNPCQPTGSCPNAPQLAGNSAFPIGPFGPANALLTPGTLQRYGVYAPGYEDLDLSFKKVFAFTEKSSFQLRMDAFDALNHTNLSGMIATVNSGNFGQLTQATPRTVQIGGRIEF